MTTLTIDLDEKTHALLNRAAVDLKLSKTALAQAGITQYLEQQLARNEEKERLAATFIVTSKEDVIRRVAESEMSHSLSDEEYERQMDEFFAKELGLIR